MSCPRTLPRKTQRIRCSSNPGPLDYESNTLPRSHAGPRKQDQPQIDMCKAVYPTSSNWVLTLYHTIQIFNNPQGRRLWKTLWEKEKMLVTRFSPFPTMFSTLSKREIIILATSNFTSANAFNFVQSKILSFGKELTIKCNSVKQQLNFHNFLYNQFTFMDP